jgi:hypothetical protein
MGWTAMFYYSASFWSASNRGCIFLGVVYIANICVGHVAFMTMK